jgi:hypothetical protein
MGQLGVKAARVDVIKEAGLFFEWLLNSVMPEYSQGFFGSMNRGSGKYPQNYPPNLA